jgi:4-hydroxy-2-oxoheptanedioate aldolase
LAASLGHLGNPQAPDVQNAMQNAVKRLKALGKPAGILTANEEEARRYIDWGYLFVAVGADVGLLARNADALAKTFKA